VTNSDLPIVALRPELEQAFCENSRFIIQAPTGSGKSTQIPQMIVDGNLSGEGQVVILQPRRLAARLLARRVAWERGEELGREVGYQVRFENITSSRTRIRYVTEGILLRQMISDPQLKDISCIIFDEFHERHLYGDITLAQAVQLQDSSRSDLKIVVMSATLDGRLLAGYLQHATILTSEGRMYPVETKYLPRSVDFRKTPVWEVAADAFERWVKNGGEGDALVFMPGAYEIRKTVDEIRHRSASKGFAVLPLHGEMPPKEQDQAVSRSDGRKVVVATNVAETSITIDGIQAVIDSGLARVARYDPHRGINTLLIEKISGASADQRQGRAGRLAPGRCIRLWTESEHRQRPLQETAEIKRVDLAETILTLKAIGVADIHTFPWVESPEEKSLQRSIVLLQDLGAIDQEGELTSLGTRMVSFPVHPRYSRMLLAGEAFDCVWQVALIAALMQGKGILIRKIGKREKEQRLAQLGEEVASDFLHLMRAWSYADRNRYDLRRCQDLGIHAGAARQVKPLFSHFLHIAEKEGLTINEYPPDDTALQKCILLAFSDQLAKRRDQGTLHCKLIHGRTGELARESAVRNSPLIVASEIREIQRGGDRKLSVLLTQATAVEESWLEELFPGEFSESQQTVYDPARKRVVSVQERRFRDLVLESRSGDQVDDDQAARILAHEVLEGNLKLHHWDHAVEQWITRVNCLAHWCPEWAVPSITDDARETILEQICLGARSAKDLKQRHVWPTLKMWLTPAQQELIDKYVPERIELPSGRKVKVKYTEGAAPVIAATIQILYDLHETPRLADGKVAVCIEILAPNQRPVQITEDMASFWRDHYPRIKQELQRKYYKHEWR